MSHSMQSPRQTMLDMLDKKYEELSANITGTQWERGSAKHHLCTISNGAMLQALYESIRERLLVFPGGTEIEAESWESICDDLDGIIRTRSDMISPDMMKDICIALRRSRVRIREQFGYKHYSLNHQ